MVTGSVRLEMIVAVMLRRKMKITVDHEHERQVQRHA